ncbi:MAG: tetratricopeptide repeat protein [Deltaproteobacteria bacterium]|nr:tetratricopeptide repeat protein [Deltaproteobacteria bacterium]
MSASLSPRLQVGAGEDRSEAKEALARCRALVERTLEGFDAHEHRRTGNEMVVEFATPAEAIDCALRIQRSIDLRNANVSPENRVVLGIGIHHESIDEGDTQGVGDSMLRITSALCKLAQSTNGIFISADVREQLKGKLGLRFMEFRSQRVEGESQAIHAYQVFSGGGASDLIGNAMSAVTGVNRATAPILVLVLLIVIGVVATRFDLKGIEISGLSQAPVVASIAIPPFIGDGLRSSGDTYRDTMPAQMIDALSQFEDLHVASRSVSFALRDHAGDPAEIGRRLGVDAVVTGFASTSGDWLLARAAVIRVEDKSELWSGAYYRRSSESEKIVQEMVRSMSRALELKIDAPNGAIANPRTFIPLVPNEVEFGKMQVELEDALKQVQKLPIEETHKVTSLNNLASLYYDSGRDAQALPLYIEVLETRERTLGHGHPEVAVSLNNLASVYLAMGEYEKAEPLYIRSLEIRENTLGLTHPRVGNALSNLASLYHRQGRLEEAEIHYQRALEIRERELQIEPSSETGDLNDKAARAQLLGELEDAEKFYRQALATELGLSGKGHVRTAVATRNLAVVRGLQGSTGEADSLFRRAKSLFSSNLSPRHSEVGRTLTDLGELHRRDGHLTQARKYHEEALEAYEDSTGIDSPEAAGALGYLVAIFEVEGSVKEVADARARQKQIRDSYLGRVFSYTAARSANHSVARDRIQDDLSQPQPMHEYLVMLDKGKLVAEKQQLAENLHNLALLYVDQGRYIEAEQQNLRALAIRESLTGREHPKVAMSLHSLGRVHTLQDRFLDAEVRFKEAMRIFEVTLGHVHPHVARGWEGLEAMWHRADRAGEAEYAAHRAQLIRKALAGTQTKAQ